MVARIGVAPGSLISNPAAQPPTNISSSRSRRDKLDSFEVRIVHIHSDTLLQNEQILRLERYLLRADSNHILDS